MKTSVVLMTAFAGTSFAIPSILKRQSTSNDILQGKGCKGVTLIFARASTEPGNMGGSMGPKTCSGLKSKFAGDVACQGVGRPYTAGLADNVAPAGTTSAAINEAIRMFTQTNSKCPNTIMVGGGYSQGSAVMMNAVSKLDANIKQKVAGVVLFGYTKNKQTKSSIPNYPKEKVSVYCSKSDGVCGGTLAVTAGHFSYMGDGSGPKSVAFLVSKINEAKSGRGSSGGAAETMSSGKGGKGKGLGGKGLGGKGKGKGSAGAAPEAAAEPAAEPAAEAAAPEAVAEEAAPAEEAAE